MDMELVLSPDARTLLHQGALDHCVHVDELHLMFRSDRRDFMITARTLQEFLRWNAALEELVTKGLVESVSGTVYLVTVSGCELADELDCD